MLNRKAKNAAASHMAETVGSLLPNYHQLESTREKGGKPAQYYATRLQSSDLIRKDTMFNGTESCQEVKYGKHGHIIPTPPLPGVMEKCNQCHLHFTSDLNPD